VTDEREPDLHDGVDSQGREKNGEQDYGDQYAHAIKSCTFLKRTAPRNWGRVPSSRRTRAG
jgi:hypothetical protein